MRRIMNNIAQLLKPSNKTSSASRNYKSLLESQIRPEFYIPLYTKIVASKNRQESTESFALKDQFRFGAPISEVIGTWGDTPHRVKSNGPCDGEILMYRIKVGGHRVLCHLHFQDNKLYYFSLKFRYLTEQAKQEVINQVQFKYLPDMGALDSQEMVIRDAENNHLMIQPGIDLSLQYLSGNEVTQHLIEFELDLRVAKKAQSVRRRQLELLKTI